MAFIVDISNPATFALVSEEGREEAELVSTNESEEFLATDQSQDWKFKFPSVSLRSEEHQLSGQFGTDSGLKVGEWQGNHKISGVI